jgi:hypothetical protein
MRLQKAWNDTETRLQCVHTSSSCTCFGRCKFIWPWFHGFDFQVYYPHGREISIKESKYSSRLDQLLVDPIFWGALFNVAPAVTCYLRTLPFLARGGARPGVPQESWNDVSKFGILCLEVFWIFSFELNISRSNSYPIKCTVQRCSHYKLCCGILLCIWVYLQIIPLFQSCIVNNDSTFVIC